MDKLELTEENLKKVLVGTYAQAVALRPDCEDGFRTLQPDDIRVFIYDNEISVEFPCLQVESSAFACALRAAEATSRLFFGNITSTDQDGNMVVSEETLDRFSFVTSPGYFVWTHRRL